MPTQNTFRPPVINVPKPNFIPSATNVEAHFIDFNTVEKLLFFVVRIYFFYSFFLNGLTLYLSQFLKIQPPLEHQHFASSIRSFFRLKRAAHKLCIRTYFAKFFRSNYIDNAARYLHACLLFLCQHFRTSDTLKSTCVS